MNDLGRRIRDLLVSIPGWCSPEKAQRLVDIVRVEQPSLAIEIGVFGGSSLLPIALAMREQGAGYVVGIDPWARDAALDGMVDDANRRWWSGVNLDAIYRGCVELVARESLESYVGLVRARAEDVAGAFAPGSIDLLHVDGNHSEKHALRDVGLYLPRVRAGGIVLFDDLSWSEGGEVTTRRAADSLRSACEEIDVVGDCAVLRKR